MNFIKSFEKQAKAICPRIVYPESEDERVIKAIINVYNKKLAKPILIGSKRKINNSLKKFGLKNHSIKIIDNKNYDNLIFLCEELVKLRKNKGMTFVKAKKLLLNDKNYFGTMLVKTDFADAMISGSVSTSAETIRPALQIIKGKGNGIVSSVFFMIIKNQIFLFSDCGLNVNPNYMELSSIAIRSYETAKEFGMNPKIAFLSFSTNSSSDNKEINKIKKAVKMTKKHFGDNCLVEGEMQVDAAIDKKVSQIKFPKSKVKGDANVLIFPDLNSGNIGYKLVERFAGAKAIGPILQGLNKPINDLSRGCSVQDIIDSTIITAMQVKGVKNE
jgi:phosphate acetyltransferase